MCNCNKCRENEMELLPEIETLVRRDIRGRYIQTEIGSPPPTGPRNGSQYIRWVQTSLNQLMNSGLTMDGKIGPKTRAAVSSFQRSHGLNPDGIVGLNTEQALKTALAAAPAVPTGPAPAPTVPVTPTPASMVDRNKVSCRNNPDVLRAIGTNDPAALLERICNRAVEMLTNVISEMTRIKSRVAAGDPPAWPLIGDLLGWSLQTRMLMQVDNPAAWTGTGRRNAGLIIRWLTRIRETISNRSLSYTCLWGAKGAICGKAANLNCCEPGFWAWSIPGRYHIFFCMDFWKARSGVTADLQLEFQARIIIHETSHIYYDTIDSGMGPGRAECISQFVADANGSPIDPLFAGQCGAAAP